jgi:cell wall-associated NlpC family hydrolase
MGRLKVFLYHLPRWAVENASQLVKHGLEALAEALTIDLLWAALRYAGFVGAGAAAAAVLTTAATSPPPARAAVPQKYALETHTQKELVRFAHRYGPGSGIVYVWGGDKPFGGFDCSGFVHYLYARVGITIPRGSREQWTSLTGRDVRKGHEQPGDVVYFQGSLVGANAGPPPGHEGLYIGGGKFIDYYSSGKPARVALLKDMPDYMGAKQWWKPVTVDKRDLHTVAWFAHHFHVKVSSSVKRSVTFASWRGLSHDLARWNRRRMVRWAHNHHHRTGGTRKLLAIVF